MTAARTTAQQDGASAEPNPESMVVTDARPAPAHVAELIVDLQSVGLRVEAQLETRRGGAGPTDSGMLWIEGVAATVPTVSEPGRLSPYVLKWEDAGYGIY